MRTLLPALLALVVCAACVSRSPISPGDPPAAGAVGGACLEDGGCNGNLECVAEECVSRSAGDAGPRPDDAGADSRTDAGDAPEDAGGQPTDGGPGPGADAGLAPDAGILADGGRLADGGGQPDAGAPLDAGPIVLPPCDSNDDCVGADRCSLVATPGGLESRCVSSPGLVLVGQACDADAECRSGLCEADFCSAVCERQGQCDVSQRCVTATVTRDSVSGTFDLCLTPPPLACTDNQDCEESQRVCGDLDFDDGTQLCTFPVAGGDPLGAPCTGATANNPRCEDRLCLTGFSNECSRLCDDDTDCQGSAVLRVCTTVDYGLDVRACGASCARDADCGVAGQLCAISSDPADNETEWICQEVFPARDQAPGDDCAAENRCQHGFCIRRTQDGQPVESFCSQPCEFLDDCDEDVGFTECADIEARRPDGTPQILKACSRG